MDELRAKQLAMIENLKILVVDDDALVRNVIIEYLRAFGFKHIYDARGGWQALKTIQDQKIAIDLILSDWQMPEIDGLMLLKLCRNTPFRHEVKFIMITSQVPEERIKILKAREAGVNGYVVKPFKGKLLREKIWNVLGWELNEDEKAS